MKTLLAFGAAAFLVSSSAAQAAPKKPPPTIEATGQNCIVWEFVSSVRGVHDSSYVQFHNKCPATVSFFWCKAQVYSRGLYPPCDVHRGAFNTTTAAPGWTNRISASSSGHVVVAIRECPGGYTTLSKTNGRFFCKL